MVALTVCAVVGGVEGGIWFVVIAGWLTVVVLAVLLIFLLVVLVVLPFWYEEKYSH